MDVDALFEQPSPGNSWFDWLDTTPKAAVVEIADMVVLRGREPNWAKVLREFKKEFPDSAPKQAQTVMDAVRRLVEARS